MIIIDVLFIVGVVLLFWLVVAVVIGFFSWLATREWGKSDENDNVNKDFNAKLDRQLKATKNPDGTIKMPEVSKDLEKDKKRKL